MILRVALVGLAMLMSGTVAAAGDPARGQRAFGECTACHTGSAGLGPSLVGVVGRAAASRDDYRYSPAMKRSGLVWTTANLQRFLKQPQAVVPGTKMPFAGIGSDVEIDDLIAYLMTLR